MPLSDQTLARAEELIARYPQRRSALLPILFLLQAEDGYVSPAGVAQVAELLGLTKAEVGAVATFYTMFRRRPVGKYLVSVCKTLPCQLRGSRDISEAMARRLDVPLGGTDEGGMVTMPLWSVPPRGTSSRSLIAAEISRDPRSWQGRVLHTETRYLPTGRRRNMV